MAAIYPKLGSLPNVCCGYKQVSSNYSQTMRRQLKYFSLILLTSCSVSGKTQEKSKDQSTQTIIGEWTLKETHLEQGKVFDRDNFDLSFKNQWEIMFKKDSLSKTDSIKKREIELKKFNRTCLTYLIINKDSSYTYTSGPNIKREGAYHYKDKNSLYEYFGDLKMPIELSFDGDQMTMINRTRMYVKNVYQRKK
jgi:hypothetical protein